MGEKYEYLKKVLDDSHYTVALCGSGILAETGCRTFQNQDYAYEIEQKYGRSPEDIFASAYYMTRPDSFFEFYRAEVLEKDWKPSESCYALKKLEFAVEVGEEYGVQIYISTDMSADRQKEVVEHLHGRAKLDFCTIDPIFSNSGAAPKMIQSLGGNYIGRYRLRDALADREGFVTREQSGPAL